jgi:CubicO group peptidase (beta-lactamase class C family)
MKKTIRFVLAFLVITFYSTVPITSETLQKTKPENVGLSSDRVARIDRTIQSWVDDGKISGSVTLLARHGKIAQLGVYGLQDREVGTPMSEDTIFAIMSMTKPITSLAVLMLYEEGRFLLNDPVSKYIPAFENMRVIEPQKNGASGKA